MKINQLKEIIREAVREEVKDIIEQAILYSTFKEEESTQLQTISNPSNHTTGSIYEKLKEGMNLDDLKNFSDQSIEYTPQTHHQNIKEHTTPQRPIQGVSAEQLPFIKKAGEIYKKSISKKNNFLD